MAENIYIPSLDHLNFFPGQQLTARDLTELQRFHRELRWLHNRSLHGWGIAAGFSVTGEPGDSAVTLDPGFGLDCLGREIILTEQVSKTIPAVAAGSDGNEAIYYLVASYQGDAGQKVMERRPGVCLPGGTVRLQEEPLIAWLDPTQLHEGLELILTKIWVKNCQLSRSVSSLGRRDVQMRQQPYIGAGQTGATLWNKIPQGNEMKGTMTKVDTSAANFQTTPAYVANVVGDRYLGNGSVVTGLPLVENPTPRSFTLNYYFINPISKMDDKLKLKTLQKNWYIVWMGVEG